MSFTFIQAEWNSVDVDISSENSKIFLHGIISIKTNELSHFMANIPKHMNILSFEASFIIISSSVYLKGKDFWTSHLNKVLRSFCTFQQKIVAFIPIKKTNFKGKSSFVWNGVGREKYWTHCWCGTISRTSKKSIFNGVCCCHASMVFELLIFIGVVFGLIYVLVIIAMMAQTLWFHQVLHLHNQHFDDVVQRIYIANKIVSMVSCADVIFFSSFSIHCMEIR